MKQVFTFVFLWFCAWDIQAQNHLVLSDSARISLFTAAPGEELYSIFGHNAIRVHDPLNRLDRCYDYGTFDFDQPNFYLNFCRGKLLYSLSVSSHRGFEYAYLRERRTTREQLLNLNPEQRQRVFDLLETNALPENRDYKYDFFYDNCATRIRDILKEVFYYQIAFDSTAKVPGTTMRQLLKPFLKNTPWTEFGIDLVLGASSDRVALADDYMFLPNHVHDKLAATKLDNGANLVLSERMVPENGFPAPEYHPGFFGHPLWVMCFVALLGLLSMANPRTEHIFDTIFWFILGVAGLIIALLWFATDHSATKNNLNLFWALPTHLLYFWRRTRSEWTENYFTGAAILAALMLVFWKFIPQEMPVAALPIVALVVIKGLWRRYWKRGDEIA